MRKTGQDGAPAPLAGEEHDTSIIEGTNRSDLITSGGGAQTIWGANGSDTISAGGGPDDVYGENGRDVIQGGGGPDLLIGGNGKDLILGAGGPDQIFGGNGNDTIDGGASFDTMTGGAGADTFVFTTHDEEASAVSTLSAHEEGGGEQGRPTDTITDFQPGVDVLDLSGLGAELSVSSGPAGYSVWVTQDGDNAVVFVDTNGDVTGDHAAEVMITLLKVDASTIGADDFLL